MRIQILLFLLCWFSYLPFLSSSASNNSVAGITASVNASISTEGSFADMFDRALEKEFTEEQHKKSWVEPICNFFAALFLASIGMLIHVHLLWNHVDILLASVILAITIETVVIAAVVKGFGYNNKTSVLVGMSLVQIGEFAFVLLSRASNLHLIKVTTPLPFKMIPAVIHLGVLLRWFIPDSSSEIGLKGDGFPADSAKRITLMVHNRHDIK